MPFGGFCPLPLRLGGDAETGLRAAQHARQCADMVAMKRTGPLAWLTFVQSGSTGLLISYRGCWGSQSALEPSYTYGGATGVSEWNFGDVMLDAYETEEPVTIHHAIAGAWHDGTCYGATAAVSDLSTVTVRLVGVTGSGCNGKATVVIW